MVLFAEGGEFRKEHLSGLSSKDCVGSVKASLEEAKNTPVQSALAAMAFFLLVLPCGYGIGKFVEVAIWPEVGPYFMGKTDVVRFTVVSSGKPAAYGLTDSQSAKLSGQLKVAGMQRRGDYMYLLLDIANDLTEKLEVTASVASPVHDQRGEFSRSDYIVSGVYIFPQKSRRIELGDYMPEGTEPKTLFLSVVMTYDGGTLRLSRDVRQIE